VRAALALCVVAAAVLAAGCGASGADQGPSATRVPTRLVVVIRPHGSPDDEQRIPVNCPGDERCDRLKTADLSPPPKDVACTQVYGGDATALVTGRIGGKDVYATFNLTDGCQIERWRKLSWLLGKPPTTTNAAP
jgi:hypothetical protein